jgi:hypothetical protein
MLIMKIKLGLENLLRVRPHGVGALQNKAVSIIESTRKNGGNAKVLGCVSGRDKVGTVDDITCPVPLVVGVVVGVGGSNELVCDVRK